MSKRKMTQDIVVDYLKTFSQNGKLKESLIDIADKLGYSNATIHRTLKRLEEDGLVKIIPSEAPREPNTIVYLGEIKEAQDIVLQGEQLMAKLQSLTQEVEEYLKESSRVIDYYSEKIPPRRL